jgi:[ribosomal protein S18]-alanine N-acetyltransferase
MFYRLFRPDDFEALYAIEKVCFQPPFRFDRAFMRRIVEAPNGATWIAEEEGEMAGFAVVEWTLETDAFAYLQTIEVLPGQRGRGVASELLQRSESSARTAGAPSLWLHVDATNTDAIRLYEKHGFIFQARRDHYYPQGRDALIYRKPLEQEDASKPRTR